MAALAKPKLPKKKPKVKIKVALHHVRAKLQQATDEVVNRLASIEDNQDLFKKHMAWAYAKEEEHKVMRNGYQAALRGITQRLDTLQKILEKIERQQAQHPPAHHKPELYS